MVHTKAFNSYYLYYVGNHDTVPAQLLLYDGSTFAGWVYFYHDNLTLPEPHWCNNFILYFKISEYQNVMSILRHEKPLYVLYNDQAKYAGFGTTEKEPIGEEEPRGLIRLFV